MLRTLCIMLIVQLSAFSNLSLAAMAKQQCAQYSDHFDTYNPERWHDVMLYSEGQADFAVKDGRLTIKSSQDTPCEVQVYSLFIFDGDFDIQVDYDLTAGDKLQSCRFNAGLVLQTLGDEKSYKSYVAMTPNKGLFFRGRLDRYGEQNIEKHKGNPAPERGTIRITRKKGNIDYLALVDGKWRNIYEFNEPCNENLRVRLKLQTGGDEEEGQTCPVQVRFDNFLVNSCDNIVAE